VIYFFLGHSVVTITELPILGYNTINRLKMNMYTWMHIYMLCHCRNYSFKTLLTNVVDYKLTFSYLRKCFVLLNTTQYRHCLAKALTYNCHCLWLQIICTLGMFQLNMMTTRFNTAVSRNSLSGGRMVTYSRESITLSSVMIIALYFMVCRREARGVGCWPHVDDNDASRDT